MRYLWVIILVQLFTLLPKNDYGQAIRFSDTTNVWKVIAPQYNDARPTILNYITYGKVATSVMDTYQYVQFGFGWVREDTVANKVYIRSSAADTDRILLDYNLQMGDTFRAGPNTLVVTAIDSTLINGAWHRVWKFSFFRNSGWSVGRWDSIYIVQGIGCLEGPTFHMQDWSHCVECMQPYMYCFATQTIHPALTPTVAWLDNNVSCSYYPTLAVEAVNQVSNTSISPVPANRTLAIAHNELIRSVTLTDMTGRTLMQQGFNDNSAVVDISSLAAGVYLATINGTVVLRFVKE